MSFPHHHSLQREASVLKGKGRNCLWVQAPIFRSQVSNVAILLNNTIWYPLQDQETLKHEAVIHFIVLGLN